MAKVYICSICGSDRHYETFCNFKKRKPISQRGKRSELYEGWKKTVAIPYLTQRFGYQCRRCGATSNLDVNHKQKRGSHPDLKMLVTNVEFLCRPCHIKET